MPRPLMVGCRFLGNQVDLIRLVEKNRCIWDKSCEGYCRPTRQNAWKEIALHFFPDFKSFDEKKQKLIVKAVAYRWRYIRDTYKRWLNKNQRGDTCKFQHSKHCRFLMEVFVNSDDSTDSEEETSEPNGTNSSNNEPTKPEIQKLRIKCKSLKSNRPTTSPLTLEVEQPVLPSSTATSTTLEVADSEDALFFRSLLPTIADFTPDQKLDFRMEVLRLVRQFRRK